ncbi:MAG: DUF3416 domain-containing protein [Methylobacterium frigidaeris]
MNAPRTSTAPAEPADDLGAPLPATLAPLAAGPRIYNLFPLLIGRVADWTAELPRIAGLGFDWIYLNPFHQAGGSGSLYAVADPDRLDDRFRDDDGNPDDEQIRRFAAAAAEHGLKVMTDLVINHAANDGRLVRERSDLFLRDEAGVPVSPSAVDPDDPGKVTVWGDLAEFDYHAEHAKHALTELWDGYIARLQALGVAGFRCDAAYKVPPDVWRALIGRAKERAHEALFAAETLGCTFEEARATAGSGFDYLFNSFAWWDLKASWALEQYERLRTIAPSIAFPENHDMVRLAAGIEGNPARVAAALKARYAMAAFFSAGVLMPVGYEWGYRRALHVVETTPASRETDTGVDISAFVAAINHLRAELPAANVEGAQWRISSPDAPYVALLRFDTGHQGSARHAVMVLFNPTEAPVAVDPGPLIARAGGEIGPFEDLTPDASPLPFRPDAAVSLEPGAVHILAARRVAPLEQPRPPEEPSGDGRVIIEAVTPEIDGGRSAVKRIVGERLRVEADIFTDGHDIIAAAVLSRLSGETEWRRDPMVFIDNDRWGGSFPLLRNARYEYTVEAWRDDFSSWLRGLEKKRVAGVPVHLETQEGVALVRRAATLAEGSDADTLKRLVVALEAEEAGSAAQLERILERSSVIRRNSETVSLSRYPVVLEVFADRLAARFSAWYEIFPRSQSGDPNRHGTFDDVIGRLPEIKELGFDVLYFTPIHPIGRTNRKGKNNSLKAREGDVGSVYAVGSPEGGHEAIHPELGSFDDFRRLVAASHAYGMEIALDFAIQCSPDHPWIKQHPEWFDWRPDGTIKFAENPPKKYEDIVNVEFYRGGLPSLWIELRDIIAGWCALGVRIFRVDNPHTKPIPFWEWVIRDINAVYPDAIFLAEAFTRPKMMKKLAKAGYQQSYTYFTWRNTKAELTSYSLELAGEMGEYYRPNFFANTPDINPVYLQTSGRPGFIVRGTLAATLSSVYGIYNGFELCEAAPVPGKEEYLDSEKYELKAWDYHRPGNIRDHIIRLNRIRRDNPALWDFRNVSFTAAGNDRILAYVRATPERDNVLFVMVNLDPRNRQECTYEVPLWEFGLPDDGAVEVEDLLLGYKFELRGKTHRIALDPAERSVVIWRLRRPDRVAT